MIASGVVLILYSRKKRGEIIVIKMTLSNFMNLNFKVHEITDYRSD